MKLPFLSELDAEGMWRAMGWICGRRPNERYLQSMGLCSCVDEHGIVDTYKALDMMSHARWKHKGGRTIEDACGIR